MVVLSQLLFASLAFVASTTATVVTKHTTITIQQSTSVATARPFGNHFQHHHRVHPKKCDSETSSKSDKKSKHSSKSSKKPKKTKSVSKPTSTKKVTSHKSTAAQTKAKPTSSPIRQTSSKEKISSPASKTSSKALVPAKTQASSASLSGLAKDSLEIHNELRAKHKVPALSWSNELASAAQAWTDKCAYGHGGGKAVDAGENIAAYFGGGSDVAGAIGMWSNEAKDYNWGAPAYNGSTGHFTQQVWKSTTEIGCAETLCSSLTFTYQAPWTNAYFYACEYKTAGNVVGNTLEATAKYFRDNVLQG